MASVEETSINLQQSKNVDNHLVTYNLVVSSKLEVIDWIEEMKMGKWKNESLDEIYNVLLKSDSELSYIHFVITENLDHYRLGIRKSGEKNVQEYELHYYCIYFITDRYWKV